MSRRELQEMGFSVDGSLGDTKQRYFVDKEGFLYSGRSKERAKPLQPQMGATNGGAPLVDYIYYNFSVSGVKYQLRRDDIEEFGANAPLRRR